MSIGCESGGAKFYCYASCSGPAVTSVRWTYQGNPLVGADDSFGTGLTDCWSGHGFTIAVTVTTGSGPVSDSIGSWCSPGEWA